MKANVTASEAIAWLETHDFVWYQPPMDVHPSRVWLRGSIRRWKRDSNRFAVRVEKPGLLKFTIDNLVISTASVFPRLVFVPVALRKPPSICGKGGKGYGKQLLQCPRMAP